MQFICLAAVRETFNRFARPLVAVLLLALISACFPNKPPPRTITLMVAVDQSFRSRNDWRQLVESRIARVSDLYERNFGIRWKVVDIVAWDPDEAVTDVGIARTELRLVDRKSADVLLGLSGAKRPVTRLGSVVPFSGIVVVSDFTDRTEDENTLILAHELAHLFGASHVEDKASLMYSAPAASGFDQQSATVIARMRDFDFRRGLAGIDETTARGIVEALADAMRGAAFNPVARAHVMLSFLLQDESRFSEALDQARTALSIDPKDMEAHIQIGLLLHRMGYSADAVRQLRAAIALDPRFPRAHYELALVHARAGEFADAVAEFSEVLRLRPDDIDAGFNLGVALSHLPGSIDAAIAAFREVLRLAPGHKVAEEKLTQMLAAREQLAAAAEVNRKAARRHPNDADARYNLGVTLLREGRNQAAAEEFRAALRLDPKHRSAHYNLAVTFYAAGDYRQAWEQVRAAESLGLKPKPEFVTALKERMPEP